jgi:hypothetical protein
MRHDYIGAIPECWQIYTEILSKEFSDPEYFKVHRITVDAYCAQHIGNQDDRRARQSANVHLIALYLTFEKKVTGEEVLKFLQKATKIKRDWPSLLQRSHPQWLTINDIIKAKDAPAHCDRVRRWGQCVWDAYDDCHNDLIKLYKQLMTA